MFNLFLISISKNYSEKREDNMKHTKINNLRWKGRQLFFSHLFDRRKWKLIEISIQPKMLDVLENRFTISFTLIRWEEAKIKFGISEKYLNSLFIAPYVVNVHYSYFEVFPAFHDLYFLIFLVFLYTVTALCLSHSNKTAYCYIIWIGKGKPIHIMYN